MKGFSRTVFCLVSLLAVSSLRAQLDTSEVLGTVHDASGGPVPSASVTLSNVDTGTEVKTTTNSAGEYNFFSVKIGRYTVTVEATGFSKATSNNIEVAVGARQRVDMSLQVGVVTESVQVNAAASALQTDSSQQSQVISSLAATELPLNGRDYADLALLSSNAIKSPMSDAFAPGGTPRRTRCPWAWP